MRLPDFFIIGAAKSGTTALYHYIKQHPQIYMSPKKEPHYFSFDDQTKMTQGSGDTIPLAITDFDQYVSLFESAPSDCGIGEASTSYLYREEASERIKRIIPGAKLIAILRNPVDRAYSAYMHLKRDKREDSLSFRHALNEELVRIKNNWDPIWHYTKVGYYHEQLKRYYALFPKEQIKVYLYEDLLTDQKGVLQSVFSFLGVDNNFEPEIGFKTNVSGKIKYEGLNTIASRFFNQPNPVRWLARKTIPEVLRTKFTSNIRTKLVGKLEILPEDRQFLINIFKEDILALQKLLGRDLEHWIKQ